MGGKNRWGGGERGRDCLIKEIKSYTIKMKLLWTRRERTATKNIIMIFTYDMKL